MSTSGQRIVIGVFDDSARADQAIAALQRAGFDNRQIRHSSQEGSRPKGLNALFSGGKTASHENLLNDLINMGVDPEDARHFQREFQAGHPLVSVEGRGDMQNAIDIMVAQGAHGPEKLERTNMSGDLASTTSPDESHRMQLRGERLKAYVQPGLSGEVHVRKEVVTEQQTINVPVTHEEVVIEHRPPTGEAAAAGGPIEEGEEIRIPVREEQVHMTKETVPTGEVEISKREVRENRQFSEKVRHEEPSIEKEGEVPFIDTSANQPPDQPQLS
jgi:uncharacterized protein (TIGR02271 family)